MSGDFKTDFVQMVERLTGAPVFYEMIPEDNEQWPAIAYVVDDQIVTAELEGSPENNPVLAAVEITGLNIDDIDLITCKLLSLSGRRVSPWFQYVIVNSMPDAGPNLDKGDSFYTVISSITLIK